LLGKWEKGEISLDEQVKLIRCLLEIKYLLQKWEEEEIFGRPLAEFESLVSGIKEKLVDLISEKEGGKE